MGVKPCLATGEGGELTRAQEAEQRLIPSRERLVDSLPADPSQWSAAQQVSELTYQLLDFHRPADKPGWWELFARMDMTEDELVEDAECLAALTLDPATPPELVKRSTVYTYLAPEQETKLANGDSCTRTDTAHILGKIAFDEASRRVQLRLGPKKDPLPQRLSIGPTGPIPSAALVNALYRLAGSFIAQDGKYLTLERLLLRELPRLNGWAPGQPIISAGQDLVLGSIEAVQAMDHTCLYVQGPPGSGKTYTGSRMIVSLLARGWRVGIMSNSHKAINNLLAGVMKAAAEQGVDVDAVKKSTAGKPDSEFDDPIGGVENLYDNGEVWASGAKLVAGTAWLFSDKTADQQFDALFESSPSNRDKRWFTTVMSRIRPDGAAGNRTTDHHWHAARGGRAADRPRNRFGIASEWPAESLCTDQFTRAAILIQSRLMAMEHQIRTFLADHHRGGIGVRRDHRWHDRRVNDAQTFDSTHAQMRVYDGSFVTPHAAAAARVEDSAAFSSGESLQVLIARDLVSGQIFLARE